MNSSVLRQAFAVLLCFISFAVLAQDAGVTQLDDIVVTASRSSQQRADIVGDVSVIDQDELRRAGQSSLAQVLARHHGIQFYNQGGAQTTSGVFLRGANADQTLVLLDGVPINGATSGLSALNALPTAAIERIEILRGSASSLYGANAIGGVINIMTRKGADRPFSAQASAGVGTYGTTRYSASLSGQTDRWSYSLGSSYGQSRGYNATNSAEPYAYNPDKDSYYSTNLNGALGYEWFKGQKITFQAYNTRINGGIDFDRANPYNDRSIQTLRMYSLTSENQLTRNWKSTLRYAHTLDENRTRTATSDTIFSTRQNQISWQNELALDDTQKLVLAYERLDQTVAGDIPVYGTNELIDFDQTERHNNAFTGVYTADFDRHHLQASARRDNDSQFGHASTWGLSYGYDLTRMLRGYVAASTGFKTPTFNDLYYPGYANPDLQPERSRNVEMGLRYTGKNTRLGMVLYQNRVRDLILYDPAIMKPNNLDRATLRGITLTAEHDYGNTTVRASADFQDPHNDTDGKQLNRRARQIYRIAADHQLGSWNIGTEYMFTGSRFDDVQNTHRLGGYGLWNLTAAYDFSQNLAIHVRWNNVLNKTYMNAYGYNPPGSNVFVNLAWRM